MLSGNIRKSVLGGLGLAAAVSATAGASTDPRTDGRRSVGSEQGDQLVVPLMH